MTLIQIDKSPNTINTISTNYDKYYKYLSYIEPINYNWFNYNSYLRIALPKVFTGYEIKQIAIYIKNMGFKYSGFELVGDTLVPTILPWDAKMMLANTKKLYQ